MSSEWIKAGEIPREELHRRIDGRRDAAYAVLDACNEPRVPPKVAELRDQGVCLYAGTAVDDYWAIAPYLVGLDAATLAWIEENLTGKPWGMFLFATVGLAELRNHFRHWIIVEDPRGKPLFFRFYDPRVLPGFLQTCSAAEIERFYGPIDELVVPATEGPMVSLARIDATPVVAGPILAPRGKRATFRIRAEQMEELNRESIEKFLARALKHLRSVLPEHWKAADDESAMAVIRAGYQRALGQNFRMEQEVLRFLEVMTFLGSTFGESRDDALAISLLRDRGVISRWPKSRKMIVTTKESIS